LLGSIPYFTLLFSSLLSSNTNLEFICCLGLVFSPSWKVLLLFTDRVVAAYFRTIAFWVGFPVEDWGRWFIFAALGGSEVGSGSFELALTTVFMVSSCVNRLSSLFVLC